MESVSKYAVSLPVYPLPLEFFRTTGMVNSKLLSLVLISVFFQRIFRKRTKKNKLVLVPVRQKVLH